MLKILTAIANRTTPKNFRIAIIPAGPRILSMTSMDFRTMKIKIRFRMIPINTTLVSKFALSDMIVVNVPDPAMYERASYMRVLSSYSPRSFSR